MSKRSNMDEQSKRTIVSLIRIVRKTYKTTMNKIEAIRAIREFDPINIDLKMAKNFFDWVTEPDNDEVSVTSLADMWCEKHWTAFTPQHIMTGCCNDEPEEKTLAASAEGVMQEYMPQIATPKAAGKPQHGDKPDLSPSSVCRCGKRPCTDEYHRVAEWMQGDPDRYNQWLAAVDAYIATREEQQ